jgi:hypothetical protein
MSVNHSTTTATVHLSSLVSIILNMGIREGRNRPPDNIKLIYTVPVPAACDRSDVVCTNVRVHGTQY